MSFEEYEETATGFAHLRFRPLTLAEFGFHRKGKSGWEVALRFLFLAEKSACYGGIQSVSVLVIQGKREYISVSR